MNGFFRSTLITFLSFALALSGLFLIAAGGLYAADMCVPWESAQKLLCRKDGEEINFSLVFWVVISLPLISFVLVSAMETRARRQRALENRLEARMRETHARYADHSGGP